MYVIYFNKANWRESECNCIAFLKNYKCKHVSGIAIRFKLVEIPHAAKSVPIGEKRRRGRAKRAGKALFKI